MKDDPALNQTTEPTEAEIKTFAARMAQELDVNARDAEYAVRRMLAHGLIEMKEVSP